MDQDRHLAEEVSPAHIAIVGAGFSGSVLAMRLLERSGPRTRVTLVEPREEAGMGVAYGTLDESHLLNVPAGRMSLRPEQPSHFLEWLAAQGLAFCADDFVPRRTYARYLRENLKRKADSRLTLLQDRATSWRENNHGFEIALGNNPPLACDALVIATGYSSPRWPAALGPIPSDSAAAIVDPWQPGVLSQIPASDPVTILGSGLTMVDVVLTLERQGHRGPIRIVSRQGLAPLPHTGARTPDPTLCPLPDSHDRGSPLSLLRFLRKQAQTLERSGEPWQLAFDAIRHETQKIWMAWPERERRRFLRHARPYWDIHRHRVAPQAYSIWSSVKSQGRLQISAGRIQSVSLSRDASDGNSGLLLRIVGRDQTQIQLPTAWLINCSGVQPDTSLLDTTRTLADPLRLGVLTDALSRPLRPDGEPIQNLYVLGPALRPMFWEMTAVPDLRVQAALLAHQILTPARSKPV